MATPTFLGLGAQKCASSWIHKILEDHPEVFVSQPKELDFFTSFYNRGYTWYEQHFNRADEAAAIGEISPSYFCDVQAPARVHRYAPKIKLVLALRDPLQRAFSNHLHEIRKAHYHGSDLTFEAGLATNPMYVEQSRYGAHLANWLRFFPADRILILVQEEIPLDPVAQAERLYRFLGVDPGHRSEFLLARSHETVGARNTTLFKAWRALGDYGRRQGLGRLVEQVKSLPPVRTVMRANRRELKTEIPAMRAQTEARLTQELGPDLCRLAELTGRRDWPWPTWQRLQAETMAGGVAAAE